MSDKPTSSYGHGSMCHCDACNAESNRKHDQPQSPPGLPEEFRGDWVRAHWPEVVPSSALGRLRAALERLEILDKEYHELIDFMDELKKDLSNAYAEIALLKAKISD